jgi:hypothetical protein
MNWELRLRFHGLLQIKCGVTPQFRAGLIVPTIQCSRAAVSELSVMRSWSNNLETFLATLVSWSGQESARQFRAPCVIPIWPTVSRKTVRCAAYRLWFWTVPTPSSLSGLPFPGVFSGRTLPVASSWSPSRWMLFCSTSFRFPRGCLSAI